MLHDLKDLNRLYLAACISVAHTRSLMDCAVCHNSRASTLYSLKTKMNIIVYLIFYDRFYETII